MSKYSEMLDQIRAADSIRTKTGLVMVFTRVLNGVRHDLYSDERAEIIDLVIEELSAFNEKVLSAKDYKEKFTLFEYEDSLLQLLSIATGYVGELTEEQLAVIRAVEELVKGETTVEDSIDSLFAKDEVSLDDANEVITLVSGIDDVFRRSLFFTGIIKYKDDIEKKFSNDAWKAVSDYISSELDGYIAKGTNMNSDDIDSLELAADACKYFMTDDIAKKLTELISFGHNAVNFYAVDTLIEKGREVPSDAVAALANDLAYAELIYSVLEKNKKTELFPSELYSREYIEMSSMVHWLMFPTELGEKPDEIEYLGSFKIKKEDYYIFKFRSDSENLDDEIRGEWLIGWTSSEGNTFSNFDCLSSFEDKKHTPKKTLKNIKRYLK